MNNKKKRYRRKVKEESTVVHFQAAISKKKKKKKNSNKTKKQLSIYTYGNISDIIAYISPNMLSPTTSAISMIRYSGRKKSSHGSTNRL